MARRQPLSRPALSGGEGGSGQKISREKIGTGGRPQAKDASKARFIRGENEAMHRLGGVTGYRSREESAAEPAGPVGGFCEQARPGRFSELSPANASRPRSREPSHHDIVPRRREARAETEERTRGSQTKGFISNRSGRVETGERRPSSSGERIRWRGSSRQQRGRRGEEPGSHAGQGSGEAAGQ